MPTHKDFKRLVRRRMQKTGEAYTAARAHLLNRSRPRPRPHPGFAIPQTAAPLPAEYARLAGISDAALKAKTGCTWDRWVKALDHAEAHTWSHREITKYVGEKYKTPSWWTQMVTVGYERIKGLRAIGQLRSGSFVVSKSRTFPVPLPRLYGAFADSRTRVRWLPGAALRVRTASRDKSMRITWGEGGSLEARFTSKGAGKSHVAIDHGKLADQATATRIKQFWSERLDALGALLMSESG